MGKPPTRPAYSIDEVYGSQLKLHGETTVTEAASRARFNVVFVSFNVGGIEASRNVGDVELEYEIMVPKPWQPLLYTNMIDGAGDVLVAKAATSSGAMPGQLGSLDGNVDGAFFNHDPTIAASPSPYRAACSSRTSSRSRLAPA